MKRIRGLAARVRPRVLASAWPWMCVELAGWGVVSAGLYDLFAPLGYLMVGWVLISVGGAQQKRRGGRQ